jgi:hypothetical protein
MRRLQLFSFAVFALAGCSGGGDGDGTVTPPPTPTVAVQASPSPVTITRGASGTTTVTVTRGGNYTGAVQLATGTPVPDGMTVTFNPSSLSSTTTTATATIAVASTANAGGNVTITASGAGVTTATTTLAVNLTPMTITFAEIGALSVVQGGSGNVPLTITRAGGFAGAVTVTASAASLPQGVTIAPVTIAAGATTGTMVVNVAANAAITNTPAAITLSAAGTGVTAQDRTLNLSVTAATIPTISLTPSVAAASIAVGGSTSTTITVNRAGGFAGAVALAVANAPAGMTATLTPASVTAGATTSQLAVTTTASVVPGAYTLNVTGSGTGVTNATTTFVVTVTPAPGITIGAASTALTAVAGASTSTGITLVRTNLTSDVTLTATGAPAGVTVAFAPSTLSGTTLASTMNLTVGATAIAGTYPIVVNASGGLTGGGTTTAQVTVNLTVTAAQSYTLSATAASLQQGGTGTSTVTITRAGGFTGAVNLAVTNLPSGVTAAFNPVAPTGNTSTLTLTATAGATTGAFTATITGTSGTLANVTATVAGTVTATGGGSGNVTARFCDAAEYPLWVAYRSGTSGAWTRVTAGANQTYSFSISGVGGMAWAKPDGSNGFAVTVYYGSSQELGAYGTAECANNPAAGKSLTGTFAGLSGPLQTGQVSVGSAFAQSTFGQTGFSLTGVYDGVTDLVAFRASTTVNGSSVSIVPDKGILRRNVNYANGSAIPTLDFNASEAFTPASAQITVTNPSGGLLSVFALLQTGNGSFSGFSFGNLGGSAATNTVYGLPSSLTQSGDFHLVQATSTVTVNNVPVSARSVSMFNRDLANRTMTLGPDLAISGSGLVTIATTPYARLRVDGSWQSDYGDMLFGTFSQSSGSVNRSWVVSATRAYYAGASTYAVEMPDFSGVAGFDNNWGLRAGTSVSFGAIAYSSGGATATTEGLTIRSASVYGTRTP